MTAIGWRAARAGLTARPVSGAGTVTGVGTGVSVGDGLALGSGLRLGVSLGISTDGLSLGPIETCANGVVLGFVLPHATMSRMIASAPAIRRIGMETRVDISNLSADGAASVAGQDTLSQRKTHSETR